jgi:hypothetical protein
MSASPLEIGAGLVRPPLSLALVRPACISAQIEEPCGEQ